MIRTITVLSFALLCMHTATAQHATKNPRNAFAHFIPTTGAKTTAVESRLIAVSGYYEDNGNIELGDTTRAWYSGNNGWAPELGEYFEWKVDSAQVWYYDPSLPGLVDGDRVKATINAAKQVTRFDYESWDDNSGSWAHNQVVRYTYNTAGQVASFMEAYDSGSGWDSVKTVNTYNGSGQLTQEVYQQWDGSAWVSDNRTTYTYNTNGSIATELYEDYNGTSWTPINRLTNTYTGGKKTSILTESYNGTSWQNSGLTTITYNTAGQMTDSLIQQFQMDFQRYMRSYSSTGDTVTTIIQLAWGGTLENLRRETVAYNSFHQPTWERTELWDNNASQFDFSSDTYYYYEQFTNSVKDLSANANGKMHVYPVPARDYMNLELDWKTAAAASIALCDMNGRVVKNWNTQAVKTYKTQLDLTGIPAGNYILKVAAGADRLVQQVSIVK